MLMVDGVEGNLFTYEGIKILYTVCVGGGGEAIIFNV